jgi:hypothetical protein
MIAGVFIRILLKTKSPVFGGTIFCTETKFDEGNNRVGVLPEVDKKLNK